ncbi:response regulator [Desulfovibrio psychrotolerans]|uniref:Response regulatory domain-containing protein n=1 Tax=Desulfovibrio psychrotolerans TaxID=415242 RepID=A0A7J0BR03_9BACT|nr:response regulator [Desulfovibrio psychrotolerans]GFM36146.1 hypothetical protein DSM19430T_08300 [Desulfovibrio psychrotolerans]
MVSGASFFSGRNILSDARPEARPDARYGSEACPQLKPLRILVADSNPLGCKFICAMLSRRGHHAAGVQDGAAAVAELLRHPYDALVTELALPGVDGAQLAQAVRTSTAPNLDPQMPVLALAARDAEEDRQRCVQSGMDGYLVKPAGARELLRALYEALLGYGRDARAKHPAEAARMMGAALRPVPMVEEDFGLETEDVRTLYAVLCGSLPDELATLRDAVAQGDLERVAGLAHALAGSVLDIVAEGPTLLAREMEYAARNGDAEEVVDLCAELEPQVRLLHGLLCRGVAGA